MICASGMVWPLENVPVIWFWLSTETDCKLTGGEAVLLQLADLRRAAGVGELGQAVGAEIELRRCRACRRSRSGFAASRWKSADAIGRSN